MTNRLWERGKEAEKRNAVQKQPIDEKKEREALKSNRAQRKNPSKGVITKKNQQWVPKRRFTVRSGVVNKEEHLIGLQPKPFEKVDSAENFNLSFSQIDN